MSDAELIRMMDGEGDNGERVSLAERLSRDPASALRLEELRGRASAVSSWLQDLDADDITSAAVSRELRERITTTTGAHPADRVEPHTSRASAWVSVRGIISAAPPLLRAAAIVLVFASAAMAIPPARAWLLHSIDRAVAALGLASPPPPPAPPENTGDPASDVLYHFDVASETFSLRLSGTLAGVLVLGRSAGETGSVQIRGDANASVVLASGEALINAGGDASATFEVKLPSAVKSVALRIAGRPDERVMLQEDASWTRRFELTPR